VITVVLLLREILLLFVAGTATFADSEARCADLYEKCATGRKRTPGGASAVNQQAGKTYRPAPAVP
jgi:hypothetical protein